MTAADRVAESDRQAKAMETQPHPSGQNGELGIACKRIDAVLRKQGGFDVVMLDCEGCEETAILNWDFEANPVGILTVEMPPTPAMLRKIKVARLQYVGQFVDHIWVQPTYIYEQNRESFAQGGRCKAY